MQIILASAKIMNDKVKSVPDINLSTPRFQSEAEGFARNMALYSTETLAEMLGCSQQIAIHNRLRFMQFFDEKPKLPAILAINRKTGEIRSGQISGLKNYDYCLLKFGNTQYSSAELEMAYYFCFRYVQIKGRF